VPADIFPVINNIAGFKAGSEMRRVIMEWEVPTIVPLQHEDDETSGVGCSCYGGSCTSLCCKEGGAAECGCSAGFTVM